MLAKIKLNTIETLNSIALIESNIGMTSFFSVNSVLKEYDAIKEAIKNRKFLVNRLCINIIDISREPYKHMEETTYIL